MISSIIKIIRSLLFALHLLLLRLELHVLVLVPELIGLIRRKI